MADLIIKPSSGNSLVFQDEGGDAALTVGTTGNTTLAGTANNLGTVTAGTFPAGMITKYERTLSSDPTKQISTTSYDDTTGTSVSYTPATGASKVCYKTKFFVMGDQNDPLLIAHFKIVHDGSDVNDSRFYLDPRGAGDTIFVYGPLSIDYVLPAWTGAKTTKVQHRSYGTSYDFALHEVYLFDGGSANLKYPIETIMYSIM